MARLPNTEGVEVGGYFLFPEGTYTFSLVNSEEATSQSSGEPMTKLILQHENGRELHSYLSHSLKALWKVVEFKEAIGMPATEENLDQYCAGHGTKLWIELSVDEYGGKKRNKVVAFMPYSGTETADDKKVATPDDLPF